MKVSYFSEWCLLLWLLSARYKPSNDCQLHHLQCQNAVVNSCENGFGGGHCLNPDADGGNSANCSFTVFPNGFSEEYQGRTVSCSQSGGCERVNCPAGCEAEASSTSCTCRADWRLNGVVNIEPPFCLEGSEDASCHKQFFECNTVRFNFCDQGYGSGLCLNNEPDRNCTITYYPDGFSHPVDGHLLNCDHGSGCEAIECSDGCRGSWNINGLSEIVPANCTANHGRDCRLRYFHCDDVVFTSCFDGLGDGYCRSPVTGDNCSLSVYPEHYYGHDNYHRNETCNDSGGCEKIICSSNCYGNWLLSDEIVHDSIFLDPSCREKGISGINDGSCKLQYFKCPDLSLDFCYKGNGAGTCPHKKQNSRCEIGLYSNGSLGAYGDGAYEDFSWNCTQISGCEAVSCDVNGGTCTGVWSDSIYTDPGNCFPHRGKACVPGCQLSYFQCDEFSPEDCTCYGPEGQYDELSFSGTCYNSEILDNCDVTVYQKGAKDYDDNILCASEEGCEVVSCPGDDCGDDCDCKGQWNLYGKTTMNPPGCLLVRKDAPVPKNNQNLVIGLGVAGGVVGFAISAASIGGLVYCLVKHYRRGSYQSIDPVN